MYLQSFVDIKSVNDQIIIRILKGKYYLFNKSKSQRLGQIHNTRNIDDKRSHQYKSVMSNSFKGRDARKECWNAKDIYWVCLDEAEKSNLDPEAAKTKCAVLREPYASLCGHKWVRLN